MKATEILRKTVRSACSEPFLTLSMPCLCVGVLIFGFESLSVGLDVGVFETVAFFAVENLEPDSEEEGENSEACKKEHGDSVVILHGVVDSGVGPHEHVADENWKEGKANVLHPED